MFHVKHLNRKGNTIMMIDRNAEGAWRITALVGGYYVTRTFYGYTKKEAVALFRDHIKNSR